MSWNPVDFMIHKTGQSRAEITAKHGLGKNLLLKASQGRVQSITPKIETVLWKEWKERGIDQDLFDEQFRTLSLDQAYQGWRSDVRFGRRGLVPTKLSQDTSISPFRRLTNAIGSLSKTAKLLMVPDRPVQVYAEGSVQTMPEPIEHALVALGYPYVEELKRAQKTWQEKH